MVQSWQAEQYLVQGNVRIRLGEPHAGARKMLADVLAGPVLGEIVENLEARIKETLNTTSKGQLDSQDSENVYRLLGAYRSVSEAMGNYVASTDAMHWSRWKEEKF